MNWIEIKEKYPKGHLKSLSWVKPMKPNTDKLYDYTARWLYDFFDEQGIIIEITLSYTNDINWFEYNIDLLDDRDDWYSSEQEPDYKEPYKTKTRTEAEEQAFLKAFEILEGKL